MEFSDIVVSAADTGVLVQHRTERKVVGKNAFECSIHQRADARRPRRHLLEQKVDGIARITTTAIIVVTDAGVLVQHRSEQKVVGKDANDGVCYSS